MARFCFVLWDGGGNVTATLPIVRSLVQRGHDVDVLAEPVLREAVESTAARFHRFATVPPSALTTGDTPLSRGRSSVAEMAWSTRWLFGKAFRAGQDLVDHLARHPADVVAIDVMLFGAAAGAAASGVPSAAIVHSVWPFPLAGAVPPATGFLPPAGPLDRLRHRAVRAGVRAAYGVLAARINLAARGLGVPPAKLPLGPLMRYDAMLVLTSESFDFVPEALPAHAVYVGPPLHQDVPSPGSAAPDEPMVLVSLSTTPQNQGALLERLATALARLQVRAVMTTGPVDPATIPASRYVEAVRRAPHHELLPRASAAVTHGGHGTTIAALAHGVPVVCIPHGRDQPDVAARVVAAGAGIRVSKRASVDDLADAVRRVLDDPGYRTAAGRLAAALRAEGAGASRAADELERLAAGRCLRR